MQCAAERGLSNADFVLVPVEVGFGFSGGCCVLLTHYILLLLLDQFFDRDGVGGDFLNAIVSSFNPTSCSSNVSGLTSASIVMKQYVVSIGKVGISTQSVGLPGIVGM